MPASKTVLKAGRPSGRTAAHVAKPLEKIDEVMRLNVNLPKAQHLKMKRWALDNNLTLSDLVLNSVNEYMSKHSK